MTSKTCRRGHDDWYWYTYKSGPKMGQMKRTCRVCNRAYQRRRRGGDAAELVLTPEQELAELIATQRDDSNWYRRYWGRDEIPMDPAWFGYSQGKELM